MELTLQIGNKTYQVDTANSLSIGIPLELDGQQPNHFGVPLASRKPIESDGFIGCTKQGGSCNVDTISLIPHCNGTHTETVGHIVDATVPLHSSLTEPFLSALLLTVVPCSADETEETYRPALEVKDTVITAEMLRESSSSWENSVDSLIIRTSPNSTDKKSRCYDADHQPPFLTVEAMQWIVSGGFRHVLVDFPSVDRMYDEGLLTNHHIFWNIPEGSHQLSDQCDVHRTITEMVFVDDAVSDGYYLLNIQAPGFSVDAAPSRPFLFPLNEHV